MDFSVTVKTLLDKIRALRQQDLDRKKILLIALVAIAIVFVDFSILVKLQLKGIRAVSPQVLKLKTDIKKLNKDLNNLKGRQVEIEEKGHLERKRLILEREIPLLLEKISLTANEYDVKITKILPSRDPKSGFFAISLELVGDYHNLGRFLNDLENAPDFIAVEEIIIKSNANDYFKQNVNLVLKTYVKK